MESLDCLYFSREVVISNKGHSQFEQLHDKYLWLVSCSFFLASLVL